MQKYHITIRILHWLIGVSVLLMIAIGYMMTNYLPDSTRFALYPGHKAVGFTVLLLMFFRILARALTKSPKMPKEISKLEAFVSKLVHFLLYFLVIVTATSGYVMSCASGKTISWFGLFNVPLFIGQNKYLAATAHGLHSVLPYVLLSFIFLHILGTLKHLLFDKVNIIKRIT